MVCPDLQAAALKNIPRVVFDSCANVYFASDTPPCLRVLRPYESRVNSLPPSCAKAAYVGWTAYFRQRIGKAEQRSQEQKLADALAKRMPKP